MATTLSEIQLPSSHKAFFVISTVLSGVNYTLEFVYNSRSRTYLIVLADGNGDICSFLPVPLVDVLDPFRYNERVPPGLLVFTSSSEVDTVAPDFNEMGPGTRVSFFYVESS